MQRLTPPMYATRKAGDVSTARLVDFKLHHKSKKLSAAQRLGLAFEKKAIVHLNWELSDEVFAHPTFRFNNGTPLDQYAIPDALWVAGKTLTIFEIKLRHTADAYYQLKDLYAPIIAKAYPGFAINLVEICRHYDRTIKLPGKVTFVDNLKAHCEIPREGFGIYLWGGR
jgi:hypothetical protein